MKQHTFLRLALVATLLVGLAGSAAAQSTPIATRTAPVCAPTSLQPFLHYSTADGRWKCEAVGLLEKVNYFLNIPQGLTTNLYTVTVPNLNLSALIHVQLTTMLGAGGDVGPGECSAVLSGDIQITRNVGTAAAVSAATAYGTGNACIAGAEAVTTYSYAVSSVSGGAAANNTFTIQNRMLGSGSATNHRTTAIVTMTTTTPLITVNCNATCFP